MSLGRIAVLLIYAVVAFRTAYGGGWWRSAGRAFAAIVGGTIATFSQQP
jgi:hypothetical protein